MNENSKKNELSLEIILQDIKHWLFLILCISLSVSFLYYSYKLKTTNEVYEVSSTFVITSNGSTDSLKNLSKAQEVSSVLSKILDRPEMKKIILQEVGGSSLECTITSKLIEETNLIKLSVSSENLRRAYTVLQSILANQKVFIDYISDYVSMELLVSPEISSRELEVFNIAKESALVFAGVLLALIILIGFFSYKKTTIKSASTIENNLDIKCLGIVPKESGYRKLFKNKNLLVSRPSISFQYVESINRLCRRIRNKMHGDTDTPMKTLMVTSCRENEGKSTIAANIAYSLYESGKNVLIIDLDLVNPSIYKIFSVTESLTALRNFLMGEKVENLIRTLEDDGLSAIINTERVSDTLDLLSSKRLEQLLKSVRDSFDYIIIDSPPISNVADSEILSDLMDATLLVIKQNYVKEENIIDVISQLKASKSELIGCVLNDAVVYSEIGGYDYYNKYRYGYYSYYSDDYYKRDV